MIANDAVIPNLPNIATVVCQGPGARREREGEGGIDGKREREI